MHLKFITIFFLVCCVAQVQAYRIECNFFGLIDSEVILARYEGKKLYEIEKGTTDNNGILILEEEIALPCGLYVFILPDEVSFELLIPAKNQEFQIFADYPSVLPTLVVKGNSVISEFITYQRSFISISKKQSDIQKRILSSFQNHDSVIALRNKYTQLQRKKQVVEDSFIIKNENNVLGNYIYWSQRLQEPLFQSIHADSLLFQLSAMKMPDECLVNSPLFEVYMDEFSRTMSKFYFTNQKKAVDSLITRIPNNDMRYKEVVTYLYNFYNKPNDVEKETVFRHLIENYYLSDDVDWISETLILELQQLAEDKYSLLLGEVFPRLPRSIEKELPEYNKSNSPLTWLFFIENDCKSCHDELQNLEQSKTINEQSTIYVLDLGDKITSNRLSVYPDVWHISNHASVSQELIKLLKINRVPNIYVLNDNREIVAKGHNFESIQELLKKRADHNE